jgi:hypothetical protein
MRPHNSGRKVPAWARAIDIIVLALLILAYVVATTGGYRGRAFGVRVSVTGAWRIVFWAAALWGLRHWWVPHHPILRGLRPRAWDDERLFDEVPGSQRWHAVAAGAGAILLTLAMTWPQIARLHSVPDVGDPLFSTWRAAWIAHQAARDPLHLFDGNIFYPERRTLAFSDAMIVPGLMAAPLIWAGVHQIVAYNLVFLSGFVLSGLFTFFFVRRLVGHTGAAIVAALVFGFSPYRFEHYSHLELQMSFWIPLGLWAFHRTLERGALRDGVLTGLAVALQALSSMYYGLFLVTFLVPVAAVLWRTRRPPVAALGPLAAGALIAGVLVAPLALPFLQNRKLVGERPADHVEYYSAKPLDYLSAHPRSMMWGWMRGPNMPERQLFPGALPVALAVVGLWPPLSATRLAYALALALVFDASLGFNGFVYEWLYAYVLPYRGLRVPARFSVFVGFTLSVFAAYGVRRLTGRLRSARARRLLVAALATLVLTELRPRLLLEPVWREPPPAYARLEPGAVLAEFPAPTEPRGSWFDTRYMYFSTFHWRRLLNGNSGFFPPSYVEFMTKMQSFPGAESLAYLKTRKVDYVVVHGVFMDPSAYAGVRGTLDASSDVSLVDRFTWEGREGSVYRLRP